MKTKNFLLNLLIIPEGFLLLFLIEALLPTKGYEMGMMILFGMSFLITIISFIIGLYFVFKKEQYNTRKVLLINLLINGILQILCWTPIIGSCPECI
jgi:hypothetical protein